MMKRILFMGPLAPPYTGQSVAFTTVVSHLKKDNDIVINISNKDSILKGIGLCLQITYHMLFHRFSRIYFTCSRSMAGSVRDLVLLFWARLRHIPVVNHLHGSDFKHFYNESPGWYRKMIRWCYKSVETSIVLTEGMKSEFSDFPSMKVKVISNGYASGLDDCPEEKNEKADDRIRVVYLSNIMKTKGILHLLDAFDNILPQHQNISLSIAGAPLGDHACSEAEISRSFNDHFEKLIALYPDRINYRGVCSGEKKKQLLWESDVFVLPTYYPTEAFPISILEAMRTGNYILTTNHRFIPEVVSGLNGDLIQPDSTEAIIDAVQKIAVNADKLRSVQNYNIKYAQDKFNEKQYIDGVANVLY